MPRCSLVTVVHLRETTLWKSMTVTTPCILSFARKVYCDCYYYTWFNRCKSVTTCMLHILLCHFTFESKSQRDIFAS